MAQFFILVSPAGKFNQDCELVAFVAGISDLR